MRTKTIPSGWMRRNGRRMDCNPYMSGALETKIRLEELAVRKDLLRSLTGGMDGLVNAGRIKRVWVDSEEYGRPFLSSTDILQTDLSRLRLISHRAVKENPKLLIRQGWTLITRAGTIGRMAYAREDMDGMACTEDVLRVIPSSDAVPSGFLYAYLSSKFGVPLVVSGTYGAIIQHIEPHHIADLPVPRLDGALEQRIHELVEEAASERARASVLRNAAVSGWTRHFGLDDIASEDTSTSFSAFAVQSSGLRRLDAAHHSPACARAQSDLASGHWPTEKLGAVARVFTPGIFKRLHVDDPSYGHAYFSGNELFQIDPEPRGFLSKKSPKIDDYIVKEDWLVIQDAGQLGGLIGRPVRLSPNAHLSVVSNHLMRVVADTREDAGYLFTLLLSPHGYRAVTRHAFGTSIPQLDPKHIAEVEVPWPDASVRAKLSEPMLASWNLQDEADVAERKAVSLVEQAIEEAS